MAERDLVEKCYVVTGANTGIGKETARELARRGARVLLACRSREKTEAAIEELRSDTGSDALEWVELDLGSLASVRSAAQQVLERVPRLDALINNAGLVRDRGVTREGFEKTFGVNHLGHFALTQLLLERLVASRPSRIVNVASDSHYSAKGIDFDALKRPTPSVTGYPEYEVSKLCNVLFTRELARRLEGKAVTAYALHPGVIASDIWRPMPWPLRSVIKIHGSIGRIGRTEGSRLTTNTCSISLRLVRVSRVCSSRDLFNCSRSSSDKVPARRDFPRRRGLTGMMAQSVMEESQ